MTNIILLDTSTLIRLIDKEKGYENIEKIINDDSSKQLAINYIQLCELYPNEEEIEKVLLELKSLRVTFFMHDWLDLIKFEGKYKGEISNQKDLFVKITDATRILPIEQIRQNRLREIEILKENKNSFWLSIPIGSNNTIISFEDIMKESKVLVNDILEEKVTERTELTIELTEILKVFDNKNQEIKIPLSALNCFLRVAAFFNILGKKGQRTDNIKLKKQRINLSFDKENKNEPDIILNLNSYPDLLLSSSYLHYIEKFITDDEHLRRLLRKIFPEYKDKIFPIDN